MSAEKERIKVSEELLDRLVETQVPELILVEDCPPADKIMIALNIVSYITFHLDKPVAFFSLEESKEQFVCRMLCSEGAIDSQCLRNGDLDDEEWNHLITAAECVVNAPVFIDDTQGITVEKICSKVRNAKEKHNISLIIIDNLQLVNCSEQVDIRQQLQTLAQEINVPVVAL